MIPANIEFEIEELVLHGFPTRDRHLIGTAVQQELSRLLTQQGISPAIMQAPTMDQLDGGTVEVGAGMSPAAIGVQIAQAIYIQFNHKRPV